MDIVTSRNTSMTTNINLLASDKTTISEMGNLQVDAIFMTTSIFNTQVRNTALQIFTIINF